MALGPTAVNNYDYILAYYCNKNVKENTVHKW